MSLEACSVLPYLKRECQSCARSVPWRFLNSHSGFAQLKAWIPQSSNYSWEFHLTFVFIYLIMYFFLKVRVSYRKLDWELVVTEMRKAAVFWCQAVWLFLKKRPVIKVWVYCAVLTSQCSRLSCQSCGLCCLCFDKVIITASLSAILHNST